MGTRDPRVDAYIARAAPFARPILTHLRELVHEACPEVEEAIKWGAPAFMYHGMLCGMAAFTRHCSFGFWKGALVVNGTRAKAGEAAGQFGRITAIADLPARRVLAGYVRKAMRLNEAGAKAPRPPKRPKPRLVVPPDLRAALAQNPRARATFERFSPSHRREYVEWITEAKREETRRRRLATAIAWLAEGKPRNWKYMK
ncbi:MAG TPA: YdeI/OmpD-associated family protein [Gemmatimonadales bacterium]|nr:YdeI/OmpD-associated family protein [Gemmatimonadales bacterium]